jgi:hypothetical protein
MPVQSDSDAEPQKPESQQTDASRGRPYPLLLWSLVVAVLAYVGSVSVYVRWRERAPTSVEYFRRVELAGQIYKPLFWLRSHDPSGLIRALIEWQYSLAHNPGFDFNSLPSNPKPAPTPTILYYTHDESFVKYFGQDIPTHIEPQTQVLGLPLQVISP